MTLNAFKFIKSLTCLLTSAILLPSTVLRKLCGKITYRSILCAPHRSNDREKLEGTGMCVVSISPVKHVKGTVEPRENTNLLSKVNVNFGYFKPIFSATKWLVDLLVELYFNTPSEIPGVYNSHLRYITVRSITFAVSLTGITVTIHFKILRPLVSDFSLKHLKTHSLNSRSFKC